MPEDASIVLVAAAHVPEWRERAADGSLRLIEAEGAGSALARMHAVDAVDDVALFTDDDCTPRTGWFDALQEAMGDPRVGAAGGEIVPAWAGGRRPWWLSPAVGPYYGERSSGPRTKQRPFGANMALRKAAVTAVGGLRSELGNTPATRGMHEETELCERIAVAGWAVAEVPAAIVDHRVRPEQLSWRWLIDRARTEGRSDIARDAPSFRPLERIAKVVAFGISVPLALIRPSHLSLVVARVVENATYLAAWLGRVRPGRRVDASIPSRQEIDR
jgi:GT2 family glycosyltransferase